MSIPRRPSRSASRLPSILLPITGIPLPFLSYGGTFMLYNFTATGIILGVDLRRYVNR